MKNPFYGVLLFILISAGAYWNSYPQTTWEFSGTTYEYQKTHFDSATSVIKSKLGIQMHTFGAPYNQIDATFLQVFSEDSNYKVLLLGQLNPSQASGQINLKNRVLFESATGVPDYNYFLNDYNSKKSSYTDYMVMQGHPYAWTTEAKLNEFQKIVNFLITEGVIFNTPYGYYQYLTDNTIPRTSKVQVILKLDDLRATASYFNPCLPTYDFLVANKIKASFGVNKMENLSKTQIDTLHYYLNQKDDNSDPLFEIWNHGLDHSMTEATTGGNWSSPSTWPGGYVPGSADDAVIPEGVTVTIDIQNAECKDLIIDGELITSKTDATSLTVYGDVMINSSGSFTSPSQTGATSNIIHNLTVYGDFTNSGGTFDFRMGSAGTTMRVLNTTFAGNENSNITVGPYSSSNNDFNSITINKENNSKIICGSDVVIDAGSSACVSQLIFQNGMIETLGNTLFVLSTSSANIVNPSSASYVNGSLGRGMSNTAGKSCLFPIGDSNAYRPITITSTTSGVATGHAAIVRCISGMANTGSSTFTGVVDKVSEVRYFKIGYTPGTAGASSMSFNNFKISYGTDDGVTLNSINLRVAYSVDNRATWNGISQTVPESVTFSDPPKQITPDDLSIPITLNNSSEMFVALSRNAGTTDNSLSNVGTSIISESQIPGEFEVKQNFPNPFNPSTNIEFTIPKQSKVVLKIYDLLGREVVTLINKEISDGRYFAQWNGKNESGNMVPSGVYFYKITTDNYSMTKKMLLMK